jgi:cytochrome c-type biogenesis protein CcmH
MKRRILLAAGLVVLCALVVIVQRAAAQTPDPSDQVHAIARQLNCPTCAGRNLADCPTDTCMQWKQEIRTQLQQGKTSQEVIDYFQSRFGPSVLQEPPKQGALLVVWVLPLAGLVILVVGALIVLRRIGKPGTATHGAANAAPAEQIDEVYAARLEEEVRQDGR